MAKPTLQSATARLRRTFHYPSDDDDDDDDSPQSASASAAGVLDEQEQESLIAALSLQNRARNAAFLRLLAALPALAALPFVLALLLPLLSPPPPPPSSSGSSSSSPGAGGRRPSRLLALLGLSSLAATGWLLFRLGVAETGFARLDSLVFSPSQGGGGRRRRGSSGGASASAGAGSALRSAGGARSETAEGSGSSGSGTVAGPRRTGPAVIWSGLGWATGRGKGKARGRDAGLLGGGMAADMDGKSPLERHLPWLNAGLALLALLTGLVERLRDGGASTGVSPLLLGALPGVVCAAVVGAKVVMAGVDPEQELSGLRYGYKGA